MHMYPGARHVNFSIFSQNDDGRKEECNLCLFLDEEVYDPLYSFECIVTNQPLRCSISQGVCCISLKEVRLHEIADHNQCVSNNASPLYYDHFYEEEVAAPQHLNVDMGNV